MHRNEDISHGTAIMNFGRVMAGSLGTALMVTFMSIGAKILSTGSSASSNHEILQRQSVCSWCRFIVCNSYWSCNYRLYFLFIYQEERHYNKNSTNTRDM